MALDPSAVVDRTRTTWDGEIQPALVDYIRVPALSVAFDPDWAEHGHLDAVVESAATWAAGRAIAGLSVEVIRLPGRTPVLWFEVPPFDGSGPSADDAPDVDTVLLYGHLDKQPPMHGWREGLGPWSPVLDGDRLYGRGGADDGYAAYASLAAIEALQAGADVFLEKPPFASLAEFAQVMEVARATGRHVQIGFQSLGSAGVTRLRDLATDGTLGTLTRISARGAWLRDRGYYERARWAGRRTLDGARVADGVVTNPLAHAIATALWLAGATTPDSITAITTELYHAHHIEADDTSFVRIDLVEGPPVCAALTLAAPGQGTAMVTLEGTQGVATYEYTRDVLHLHTRAGTTHETFPRLDLLENFVDHLQTGAPALVPLAETIGFMCVLEATQLRPAPVQIPEQYLTWEGEGSAAHPVVDDVEYWMDQALHHQEGFAAAGAPWADPAAVAIWRPNADPGPLG